MKGYFFLLSWLLLLGQAQCVANTISKVFHHKGDPGKNSVDIGRIVLYFSTDPIKHVHEGVKNAYEKELVVSFSTTSVASAYKDFHDEGNLGYSVKLAQGRNSSVDLIIRYDARQVFPEYAEFDSISMQKGVIVHMRNKQFLDTLHDIELPVLRQVSATGQPRVVIDYGHGGSDKGTIGCNNVCEKDIAFRVGTLVAHNLRESGIDVVLTREDDIFVALDERTSLANAQRTDALVSIHANSGGNGNACGIETYCSTEKLFRNREFSGQTGTQVAHKYNGIIDRKSDSLATAIHTSTLSAVRAVHGDVIDRRVKQSAAQVLLGTQAASALIEIGFLSHRQEADRLLNPIYQKELANGITQGIVNYFKQGIVHVTMPCEILMSTVSKRV